jgi:hypothetical protein
MVVQYIFTHPITILPLPLIAVFLPNAKLMLVEHYVFHQIPLTSTSKILASRITMLLIKEMTSMWILLLASTMLRVVPLSLRAPPLLWVIELIVGMIQVSYKITVQIKWFESLSFFFFGFYFIVCNFFSFEFKMKEKR